MADPGAPTALDPGRIGTPLILKALAAAHRPVAALTKVAASMHDQGMSSESSLSTADSTSSGVARERA